MPRQVGALFLDVRTTETTKSKEMMRGANTTQLEQAMTTSSSRGALVGELLGSSERRVLPCSLLPSGSRTAPFMQGGMWGLSMRRFMPTCCEGGAMAQHDIDTKSRCSSESAGGAGEAMSL